MKQKSRPQSHRSDSDKRQHFTFSKKIVFSLRPKFIYSGALKKQPSWEESEHSHDFCEVLYIRSGSGTVCVDGKQYPVQKGDLAVYNAGVSHGEISDAQNPMEVRFFAAEKIKLHGLGEGFLIPPGVAPVFSGLEYQPFFDELFDRLVEELRVKSLYYKEISQQLIRIAAHLILRLCVRSADFKEINGIYFQVKQYFDTRFAEPLCLQSVCANFFISESYLSHIFKELNGTPPMKYLFNVRLGETKKLLTETAFSVREIAQKCGFEDASYFCRAFKRTENQTPLEYRKKYSIR